MSERRDLALKTDEWPHHDLEVEETSERPVFSCYALDLEIEETSERPVFSCYALDLED